MRSMWKSGICGVIGGLAGAWAMYQFRLLWDARADATANSGIFGFDEEADVNSVDQLCDLLSLPPLSKEEALKVALVLHYGFGALAGGGYGMLERQFPKAGCGSGLLFGTALWLVGDELAISLAGLSHPAARSISSHTSALFAHLLFGVVTEVSRKSVSRLAR